MVIYFEVVRAIVVAKLVLQGISFLSSLILALTVILVPNIVISGILSSIFIIAALYTSSLTTSFFTTSFSLLKSQEHVLIYQHLIYLLYFWNC